MEPSGNPESLNPAPSPPAAEAIASSLRPPVDQRLVEEIIAHLKHHHGPDERGRAHKTRSKLPLLEVMLAIEAIQADGTLSWLRPYHLSPVPSGTWGERALVDEVLKKKCDALVRESFGGNVTKFCSEVAAEDLLSPLQDAVGGRVISVSMGGLGSSFKGSPYEMTQRYLEVIGRKEEYNWLRPYHMSKAPRETWQNPEIADEVLKKKCDALVSKEFDGDLTRFCLEVTLDHLRSPLQDAVGGGVVSVSMGGLGNSFNGSPYEMTQRYLEVIGRKEEYKWFRPYHMSKASLGTWQDAEIANEVLKKKCDALVRESFGGNLTKFCSEVTLEDLLSPLQDAVGDAIIPVSMGRLGKSFNASPYEMAQRYLELIGRKDEYNWFRPYHMSRAPRETWQNPEITDEVLKKKCDALMRESFGGNLTRFCSEVTQDHLLTPLEDAVGNTVIPVSMTGPGNSFKSSPYKMAQRYLELIGQGEQYRWFKPYHMSKAPLGTWQDPEMVNEVLKKKCDALVTERFGGNLTKFCSEVTSEDLLSPLQDAVGDTVIQVSMGGLGKYFKASPYEMAQRYLEVIGRRDEYNWFRPYHMTMAPLGTWQDPEIVNEVLRKKCDALVRESFEGNLTKFCLEVNQHQLISPLQDAVGDTVIPVSMHSLGLSFKGSPFEMAKRYLEVIGRKEEYSWFRPYHMSKAPVGIWQDPGIVEEVLKKRCDALLRESFNGKLTRFCSEVTSQDLLSPLQDAVGGRVISVSMARLALSFKGSPFEMAKRYYSICNRPFKLTKPCFIGSPETRMRRQRGEFSSRDLACVRREDGSFDTRVFGFTNFHSKDKSAVRELMLETGEHELEDRSVSYLGLETEQVTSLRGVYQRLNLVPRDSMVVESDPRRFQAMQSTVARLPKGEGRALRGVSLLQNEIERELEEAPARSFSFNLVNLDYLGQMSQSKEYALQLLLEKRLLAPRALVFVTLQDGPLARSRAESAGYSADQAQSVDQELKRLAALTGHEVFRIAALPYKGGADSSSGEGMMLWLAYRITRREAPDSDL